MRVMKKYINNLDKKNQLYIYLSIILLLVFTLSITSMSKGIVDISFVEMFHLFFSDSTSLDSTNKSILLVFVSIQLIFVSI